MDQLHSALSSRKLRLGACWLVSVGGAVVLGYFIRGHKVPPSAQPSLAVKVVSSPLDRNAHKTSLKTAEEFPNLWPAGVPRDGEGLRDYAVGILRGSNPVERSYRFLTLLRAATKENLGALIDARDLLAKQGVVRDELEHPLNFRIGELDAEERLVKHFPNAFDVPLRQGFIMQVDGWHNADPVAARAWVNSLPEGGPRDRMIETIAAEMAIAGGPGATEFLSDLPGEMQKSVAMQVATRLRARLGLGPALDRLTSEISGAGPGWAVPAANHLLDVGIHDWKSAGAVAEAIESRLGRMPITAEKLRDLGNTFAGAAPGEAFAWARRVEAQGLENAAPGSLLASMMTSVPPNKLQFTEDWLKDNPVFPGRDEAVRGLAKRIGKSDSAKAKGILKILGSQAGN